MILQKMLFSQKDICDEQEMYFGGKKFEAANEGMVIKDGGILDTDTYFNSFSIKKWKKYTRINALKLSLDIKGKCDIYLCYAWFDKDNIIRRFGDNKVFFKKESVGREKIELEFPEHKEGIIAYYRIGACEGDVCVYGGYYESDILKPDNVNIILGICTYKREEFVRRNIQKINNDLISNKDSQLYDRLEVIVSDNGQTLNCEEFNSEHISLVHNVNLGGSGGFTRCIIEAKLKQQEKQLTHIILMDDDIVLDTAVIERTYSLLASLKPEYKEAAIGGAMLRLSDRSRQFENGALYYRGMLHFENKDIDLKTIRNVMKNELNKDINYNAWCYCCMPLSRITMDNLPMPFFIHMDDVEYGVRNKFEFITINGICVWHPFYSNQRGAGIVYYDVRNKLITLSELGGMDIRDYAMFWLEVFHKSIFNYDYNRTLAACRAILDFCKGIDYFKNINPLELNKEINDYNLKWYEDDKNMKNKINNELSYNYVSKIGLIKNYILPSKYEEIVVDKDISEAYPYRAKKLIVYNHETGKYCEYKKSLWLMLKCKNECRKAKKAIKKTIVEASMEWEQRAGEIISIDFIGGGKYLNLDLKGKDNGKGAVCGHSSL